MENIEVMNFITLYLAWQRKRFIAFLCNFLSTMKTSNDLTAYIDGFKDDISGNNTLLVPFVRNGLVLYVFNKLSNRNANEAAKILALLQGRHNINIDALKRSVLRLFVKMKKKITRAWNEIVELLGEQFVFPAAVQSPENNPI